MLKEEFNLGDRVITKQSYIGTIVEKDNDLYGVLLDFKSPLGTNLYGKCEDGYGLWCKGEELRNRYKYYDKKALLNQIIKDISKMDYNTLIKVREFVEEEKLYQKELR